MSNEPYQRLTELEQIVSDIQRDNGYQRGRDDGLREAAAVVRAGGLEKRAELERAIVFGPNEAIAQDILSLCSHQESVLGLEDMRLEIARLRGRVRSLEIVLRPMVEYSKTIQSDYHLSRFRQDSCLIADQMVQQPDNGRLITIQDCLQAERVMDSCI